MFTGIIEEIGVIKGIWQNTASARLHIEAKQIMNDVQLGDSIAVNGVCLTVCTLTPSSFEADVMKETLNRTSLGLLTRGSKVNLERAMAANGRFGGHIVSGHIDGTGLITQFHQEGIATVVTIQTSPKLIRYIIEKGSIAIDGTSLTVIKVDQLNDTFCVSLIPHTKENTTLLSRNTGDLVNLENDIIGKYVERFLQPAEEATTHQSGITAEFLAKHGF
ncbi:riboflavin synthase [[Clostridium] polysaccharolyticum]|uniref:Riboflavin synthase n=1 Tax=[Clostridium] polysaccharolyticum TaxID=29364 RepID=A0A1H9ZP78_9FIRM|nr:riboflavin synthase [[Clostridium] polysaccharolyticum]SES83450.1 riboflavin synthase alpha chain [[Clostridium] polysaccharolyticum]